MNRNKLIRYLAPLAIIVVVALFIYNIYSHGTIVHPGKALYKVQCAECHGDNGEGIRALVPPLVNADFARNNPDSIPCWLKYGLNHPITVNNVQYDQPMYPSDMDEIQISNVINFMNQEFFKSDKEVNPQWVKGKLKECK